MHIRFRRTLRLLPGVHLNVSKHGISTTVGGRGAHLTFNRYGVRQSVGLPGTGLSENSYIIGRQHTHASAGEEEAHRDLEKIHQGHGIGCFLPGLGCLGILLVVALAVVLVGAGALNSHTLASITHLFAPVAHTVGTVAHKARP